MQPQFNPQKIKLIIGLGNPGKEYKNTYHNAGFSFIDYLLKEKPAISNFQFLISKSLKSDTFMNDSGRFVKKTLKKHALKLEELLIVHDDSDIALGNYKLQFGRGAAGHKGAESVIKALGTKNFWRLRIGVRTLSSRRLWPNALTPRRKAGEFVLRKIKPADRKILDGVFTDFLEKKLRRS